MRKRDKDYTGVKVGDWNVVKYISKGEYECVCDNGHKIIKQGANIAIRGLRKCEQCYQDSFLNNKYKNYTVLNYSHSFNRHRYFDCQCKCGAIRKVNDFTLIYGKAVGCGKCVRTTPKESEAINGLYAAYRSRAARRKIAFDLTIDQFKELTKMNCHYTGLPPSFIFKKRYSTYVYNGLDRIDSSIGYTLDNIVPCNGNINQMKMDLPYNDFIELCALIIKHTSEKSKDIIVNKLIAV